MSEPKESPDHIRQEQNISSDVLPQKQPRRKRCKPRFRLPKGLIEAFSRMPTLRHKPRPDLPFDIARSETVNWMIGTAVADPEFRQALHTAACQAGLIVYDRERGVWEGCQYGTDTNA